MKTIYQNTEKENRDPFLVAVFSFLLAITLSCLLGGVFGYINNKHRADELEHMFEYQPSISAEEQLALDQARRKSTNYLWLLFPTAFFGTFTLAVGCAVFIGGGGGMGIQSCEDCCP